MFLHFHKRKASFNDFANYSYHEFKLDESVWPTKNHSIQCKKHISTQYLVKLKETTLPLSKQSSTFTWSHSIQIPLQR